MSRDRYGPFGVGVGVGADTGDGTDDYDFTSLS
jgi:hypothetical protein